MSAKPIDPTEDVESTQDVAKVATGPEHRAPTNPSYSSSFSESAGGPESLIGRERLKDAGAEPVPDNSPEGTHPVPGADPR